MKLKITISVVTLLIFLSAGSYYAVSNATEYTKDKTREHYNQLRNDLTQQKEDLEQILNESKNDPAAKAKIGEKLKELRNTAMEVNALAKEVDEDAYYRNKIKSFVNALEITIEDEKITLENTDSPLDPKQAEIFQKVIKEKEKLLEDCKKIDEESVENPKLVYEELKIKVREITSQVKG